MLKDLAIQGTESIYSYFKEAVEKPNGKFQLARLFGMASRYEEQEEEKEAMKRFIGESKGRFLSDVILISDSIAIVKSEENRDGKQCIMYHPVVNGKSLHEMCDHLDLAIALAISTKYGERQMGVRAISNLLRMDDLQKEKDKFHDLIDRWHTSESDIPIHEFVGMTEEEYARYVESTSDSYLEKWILQKRK